MSIDDPSTYFYCDNCGQEDTYLLGAELTLLSEDYWENFSAYLQRFSWRIDADTGDIFCKECSN